MTRMVYKSSKTNKQIWLIFPIGKIGEFILTCNLKEYPNKITFISSLNSLSSTTWCSCIDAMLPLILIDLGGKEPGAEE